ncbi:endo-1,4-beta-xylanase [Eubacterium xylanophilum]|uniref:endo-1,4-beta-xylanase n=1 Tax=Eubacterium xylanophilum TaxID=39497 RepID=UPI0004B7BEDC|nr:endo-1,4-beta-xylanase [Eubacterium xylanophilum]
MKKNVIGMMVAGAVVLSTIGTTTTVDAAKKVKLSKKSVTLKVKKSVTLKVKNAKKSAKVSWKTSSKKVVKIAKKGKFKAKVTAKKAGSAKITCTVKSGKTKKKLTCKIKVTAAKAPASTEASQTTQAPNAATSPVETSPVSTPSEAPTATPTVEPTPTPTPFVPSVYEGAGFENGVATFDKESDIAVSNTGSAAVESVPGRSGNAIALTERKQSWWGGGSTLVVDLTEGIQKGGTYKFTAYIQLLGSMDEYVTMKVRLDNSGTVDLVEKFDVEAEAGLWTKLEGEVRIPKAVNTIGIEFATPENVEDDFAIDDLSVEMVGPVTDDEKLPSLAETYKDLFPHFGTCVSFGGRRQLREPNSLNFVKSQFNSITLENELKPSSVLANQRISVEEAKNQGYIIPDGYEEKNVPVINFGTIDEALQVLKDNNLQMRGHTMMWHQQTPSWFFGENYGNQKPTTPDLMNKRLEFYIVNVMTHIMEKEKALGCQPGDLVYTWDVSNEYLHSDDDPDQISWKDVYGNLRDKPVYIKTGFEIAYNVLKKYGVENKITLCINDYNTYDEVNEYIALANYINDGEEAKICGGLGMQSHVDVDRPTVKKFLDAVEAFVATGLEVQITELDVTINYAKKSGGFKDADQAAYVAEMMKGLINIQNTRDKNTTKGITGITCWGLYDSVSWRSANNPLFFKYYSVPKQSFFEMINAVK